MNTKLKIITVLFIVLFPTALFLKNAFFGSFVFIVLGIIAPEIIFVELILLPVIDVSMIAVNGITVTKISVIFFLVYFTLYLIFNRVKISFKKVKYVVFFLFLVLIGIVNVLLDDGVVSFAGGYSAILFENFFINVPRIVLFFLIYFYFIGKGPKFIHKTLDIIRIIIPFILFSILIYTLINKEAIYWRGLVERASFGQTDPNEFSISLISLLPFVYYNITFSKRIIVKIINLLSLIAVLYMVVASGSRAGIITFLLSIVLSGYYFKWFRASVKSYIAVLSLVSTLYIFINLKLQMIDNALLRFILTDADLGSATGNRTYFWENAIKLLPNRPVIGYGVSTNTSRYYNFLYTSGDFVMHSIIFQTLIQMGILGIITLFLMIKTPYSKMSYFKLKNQPTIIPFLSLLILLFGALSLSWLWQVTIWVNLAMCYAIINQKVTYENS